MTPMNNEQKLAVGMLNESMTSQVLSGTYLTLANLVTEMDKSPVVFSSGNIANVFMSSGFLPITQKINGGTTYYFACCAYGYNYTSPKKAGPIREAIDISFKFDDCLRAIDGTAISKLNSYFVVLSFEEYTELVNNKVWEKSDRKNYLNSIDQDSAAVESLKAILLMAISLNASDIHICPDPNFTFKSKDVVKVLLHYQEDDEEESEADKPVVNSDMGGPVYYRLLGVLNHAHTLTAIQLRKVVALIKTMSNLKLDEHRIPQDGRLGFTKEMVDQNPHYSNYDFRVSILPTIHGEKVVMRLLKRQLYSYKVQDLGFPAPELKAITDCLTNPKGLVLVIGPTGSGKTTTLYTLLSSLANGEKNILTAEDPVEIQLPGITQVSVNAKIGLNFAACARAFLRQDPDIIFIGEIRDKETAIMVAQASSSGHLVFSTLHADSALGVPGRFANLDVDAKMIVPLLLGVVAQRLTRRLCRYCIEEYDGYRELSGYFDIGATRNITLCKKGISRGCACCAGTGYDKRVLVPEVWFPDQQERDLICSGDIEYLKMLNRAKANGFKPMTETAVSLVLDKETSLLEMLRSAITREELFRDRVELSKFIVSYRAIK